MVDCVVAIHFREDNVPEEPATNGNDGGSKCEYGFVVLFDKPAVSTNQPVNILVTSK